ncbi:alpha-N-acetylglucosaminidase [Mucilaginibacter frigoritolerans]|uniref:Alpha-N-acetylglucosaminidase n=1 Tax=Mucilaginibacter frigoritolerans TaxID=652788 RepID=A0A562TK87_9SPHI|nr:alpha-N-acetylglucosaminidase [Mucilaginibacter frigoritolerans]TWI93927.1 alpha-N-acetylglucosaminidase [Mucilaginibacter frigoritolerans]
MNNKWFLFLLSFIPVITFAQGELTTSYALIKRVIPKYSNNFIVEKLSDNTAKDVFEVESRNGKIILRGNNGVAIASALYDYLTEYCHCQVTWNGTNLNMPVKLPVIVHKIHKTTPYTYRYYLNYCTYNYSMSWWDWKRWEKEIDWMAMHGINMPLALTGQEYTWYKVYKEMGFTDKELSSFFCGPAYFSWFWMGNLDGWGGPLPLSWMTSHRDLQQKILQRERAMGMTPVLQSFTGHVPATFSNHFPGSKLKKTNWNNGFSDTYILDTKDPMFNEIGAKFLAAQTKLYGTDHLYSADTFNENEPPTDDPAYLSELSLRVYQAMSKYDPRATWVMQGWLFFSDRKFWKTPQIKALLQPVPDNHMIILDLATEIEPVWKRTEAYYGKPWIWNMLHNFGGNISMFGRIEEVAKGPAAALHYPTSGKMEGIGLTMEGIEQNPVLYELMTKNVWRDQQVDLDEWLKEYILNRYGSINPHAVKAWDILRRTVYNGKEIRDAAESIITGRPTFDSTTVWTKTHLNYARKDLIPAWDEMMAAIPACGNYDGFNYDLVDVSRQVVTNYAGILQQKWVKAYQEKNIADFKKYSNQYITLIADVDTLLATRKDFLLGPWLADARNCGATPQEKSLYERNARDLITLWGDENSPLHEYSCRQWSGLLNDFYKVRWQKFFNTATDALVADKNMDLDGFTKSIKAWEWQWVITEKAYPVNAKGSSIVVAERLYKKYRPLVDAD